jgi:hypothetical protein
MAGWGTCRDCRERIWWGENPYKAGKAAPFDLDQETLHWDTCAAKERVQVGPTSHVVTACRACGGRVFWTETRNGKRRPLDADWPHEVHFDTCPGEPVSAPKADRIPLHLADHLNILELPWPTTAAALQASFRRLALIHHPDVGGTHDGFIRLRRAYDYVKQMV